jgi:hypothetical protein
MAELKTKGSVFEEFIALKIARGTLVDIDNGFVKISGTLGTIVINEKNIEKMAKVKQYGS